MLLENFETKKIELKFWTSDKDLEKKSIIINILSKKGFPLKYFILWRKLKLVIIHRKKFSVTGVGLFKSEDLNPPPPFQNSKK